MTFPLDGGRETNDVINDVSNLRKATDKGFWRQEEAFPSIVSNFRLKLKS